MPAKTCSFEGCDLPHNARGFCRSHYLQLKRGRDAADLRPIAPRLPRGATVAERLAFYSSPSGGPEDCTLFTGATNADGYGLLSIDSTARFAHRVAYELAVGPIPPGAVVRHSCDTPACVNPHHLVAGAQHENVADSIQRDRFARGENMPTHKLTDADCDRIRDAYAAGTRPSEIATWFPHVRPRHIHRVAVGARRARPTNRA